MKASEARELATEYNLKHMNGIYSKIKNAAQNGNGEIYFEENLTSHTIKQLESDGYTVRDVGGDYNYRFRITW